MHPVRFRPADCGITLLPETDTEGQERRGDATKKPTFYEQVTGVKRCFGVFLHGAFTFGVALGFVALHRVSIRTLDELS